MSEDFDERKIDELASYHSDGESFLLHLVESFYDQASKSLKVMDECVVNDEIEKLRDHAHALRSPALTLGLNAFAKMCHTLEESTATGPALMSQVGRLEEEYLKARMWLGRQTKSVQAS